MKKQNIFLAALFLSLASFSPHLQTSGCRPCCSPCDNTYCEPCDSSFCSSCCCESTPDEAVTTNKTFTGKLTYKNNKLTIYKKEIDILLYLK